MIKSSQAQPPATQAAAAEELARATSPDKLENYGDIPISFLPKASQVVANETSKRWGSRFLVCSGTPLI
jgi:hypothetical protein